MSEAFLKNITELFLLQSFIMVLKTQNISMYQFVIIKRRRKNDRRSFMLAGADW